MAKKDDKKPTAAQAAEALDQAVAKAAPDVASGKMKYKDAVAGISTTLDVDSDKVEEKLDAAIEPLKKAADAAAAAQDAQELADKAKQAADEAAIKAAEARGHVVVNVPQKYALVISAGEGTKPKRIVVQAGTSTMLREHAEHPYSKANGVKILGQAK